MSDLIDMRCAPIAAGSAPLSSELISQYCGQVPDWRIVDGKKLRREYRFATYLTGAKWVPVIASIADQEDHHPDVQLLYRKVIVEVWTHTVGGLSVNDFILAAKFDGAFVGGTKGLG